jgi:hypothetical protein
MSFLYRNTLERLALGHIATFERRSSFDSNRVSLLLNEEAVSTATVFFWHCRRVVLIQTYIYGAVCRVHTPHHELPV